MAGKRIVLERTSSCLVSFPSKDIDEKQSSISSSNAMLDNDPKQDGKKNSYKKQNENQLKKKLQTGQHSQKEAELSRLRQRYQGMESDLKMNKLRDECLKDKHSIGAREAMIRAIECDPNKNQPSKVDEKRRLPKLKLELQRLRAKHESQCQLLDNLEEMGGMNEAMQRAASIGDEITVKRLLTRGVCVNVPDDSGYTAFVYACGQGHHRIAELMITVGGASVNDSSLIMATSRSHENIIKLLLEHGAKVDRRDELNRTPLLIACENDFKEGVEIVLSAGANPNAFDKHGNTGLHHSASSGNDVIAKILLDHGANISLKNNNMMTALAVARSRRHYNVVDAITKK